MYLDPDHASPVGREQMIRQGWRMTLEKHGKDSKSNSQHGADAWRPPGMAWYRWRLLRNHICAEKIALYWKQIAMPAILKRLRGQETKAAAQKGWHDTLSAAAKAKAQAEKDAADKARAAALAEREAADKAARRAKRLAEVRRRHDREIGWCVP